MSNFDHFLGTRAVSGQHAFDMEALSAYLEKHLPGFQGPLSAEIFKGGQSNPTYKLITPQRSYVMRAKPGPVAKLLPSAHAVEREFKVMSGLQGTDVPVAKMYCLCEDEAVIGRAFYVMEFVEGRVLWDQALSGMTNAERGDIYREMNRVIAALHKVKFAERGLADYGKPGNYFERQIGRWSKQYTASITEPIPEMDALMKWLPANIPASARDESMVSVVHGDFRLGNLIVDANGLGAVLDWELAHTGDPREDIAWVCVNSWRFGHSEKRVGGFGDLPEMLDAYAAAGGARFTPDEIDWWEILGSLKWGVMCMIMYSAYKTGADPSVERAAIGRRVSENEIDLINLFEGLGRHA